MSELLDLRLRKVTVELLTGLLLRSLVAPSKEGPADIYDHVCNVQYTYIYIYICVYIYIYIYIYEGLRPLLPAPNLEYSMIGRFDDSMDG